MGEPLTPQQQAAVEHASFLVAGREVLVGEGEEYDYGDEYDLAEVPTRRVPQGSIYEAARVGDVERIQQLLEDGGANVNQRDRWDSVPLYYACLAGNPTPTALPTNTSSSSLTMALQLQDQPWVYSSFPLTQVPHVTGLHSQILEPVAWLRNEERETQNQSATVTVAVSATV